MGFLHTVPLFFRVYLNYHTIRQVVCGAFLGIILAVPWFILTQVSCMESKETLTWWSRKGGGWEWDRWLHLELENLQCFGYI